VQEVCSLVADLAMGTGHGLHGLFPAMTPTLLARQGRLQLLQLLLGLPIVARVLDTLSRGERGKVGHSQVNAHILIANIQGFRLADLARKASVPLLSLALDRERFDRACHVSMQMQFDGSDLPET